mmetsp:Transcript_23655/g.49476  ORF Transcript_23655/g.49476 Transcript_23655/m.49476 type:complete len:81 (-) Transcript_23655:263-505(-)
MGFPEETARSSDVLPFRGATGTLNPAMLTVGVAPRSPVFAPLVEDFGGLEEAGMMPRLRPLARAQSAVTDLATVRESSSL